MWMPEETEVCIWSFLQTACSRTRRSPALQHFTGEKRSRRKETISDDNIEKWRCSLSVSGNCGSGLCFSLRATVIPGYAQSLSQPISSIQVSKWHLSST